MSNGTGTSNNINVACDRKGAFVSRRDQGQGTFTASNMELQWNYGADGVNDTNTVSLNIYGIEMVYVPSGPFTIGDGNGVNSSSGSSFYAVSDHLPYTIDNLLSPNVGARGNFVNPSSNPPNFIRIDGDGGLDLNLNGVIDSAYYPTGFNAFYIMKYEVTQGQYTDFLNILTYAQQTNRVQNSTNVQGQNAWDGQVGASNRFTVIVQTPGVSPNTPRVYSTARPDRGYGMLSMADLLAYLDWAALRPMTELEFEKACRGPIPPLVSERTNGTANGWDNGPTLSGTENGTEIAVNWSIGNLLGPSTSVSQGDGGNGPVRVGLLATSTSNRLSSNKTYYGIDNLGDHIFEWMVSLGNVAGRSFIGNNGDGLLHSNGHANQGTWPGSNGNTSNSSANPFANTSGCSNNSSVAGRGFKGYYEVSNREWMANDSWAGRADFGTSAMGGRGVRSAFTSEFGFSTSSGNFLTINNPVNFEASAYTGATYSWSFPSASPSSSTTNPTNTTWSTAGTYNVSLQAIAGQCTTTTSAPLTVFTACVPPTNISWSGTTSSYSNNTWGTGRVSVDGNTNNDYINSNYTMQSWSIGTITTSNFGWTVYDLGISRLVSNFKMWSEYSCYTCCGGAVSGFELQTGSSLTGPWTTVFTGTGSGVSGWQDFPITSTTSRYWRVKINGVGPNPWNSTSCVYLHEVGFEGCN
jgi:formylglycine-generating enzyme required for sulfatase activity